MSVYLKLHTHHNALTQNETKLHMQRLSEMFKCSKCEVNVIKHTWVGQITSRLNIKILNERLFSYALRPRWNIPIPLSIKTQVVHHSGLYSTLSLCSQVKKDVEEQSRLEADENKEQTATEKRQHIQASDSITLCGIT